MNVLGLLEFCSSESFRGTGGASSSVPVGEGLDFPRPKENVCAAAFKEKPEVDLGSAGTGISLKGLSWGDLHSV